MSDGTAVLLREIDKLKREKKALREKAARQQRRADHWQERWKVDFSARNRVSLVCGRCRAIVSGSPTRYAA